MRKFVAFAAKAAVSVALLAFAIGRSNFALVGERFHRIDMWWVLAAIALAGVQTVLVAARWRQIAQHCGAGLSLPSAVRFNLIAVFFNQVLPSTVGGDAFRIWLLARDGAGWSKATYSVLLDRFIGVLVLALIVLAGLPWSLALIANPAGRAALMLIGAGCVGGALVFVLLGTWPWLRRQTFQPVRHLTEIAGQARTLLTAPATSSSVIAMSVVIQLLTAAMAWCAARSIAAPLEFSHALLLVPPVMLIATIPISVAGWGVRESALMLGFAYAGLPESDGLMVAILLGVSMLAIGLIGGAMWLLSGTRKEAVESAALAGEPDHLRR